MINSNAYWPTKIWNFMGKDISYRKRTDFPANYDIQICEGLNLWHAFFRMTYHKRDHSNSRWNFGDLIIDHFHDMYVISIIWGIPRAICGDMIWNWTVTTNWFMYFVVPQKSHIFFDEKNDYVFFSINLMRSGISINFRIFCIQYSDRNLYLFMNILSHYIS